MHKLMRADFDRLLTVLRSEPYDAAAAAEVIAAQRERARNGFELGQDLLLERLATLRPEERLAFADRLEQVLSRPPKHTGRRPDAERAGTED